MTGKSKVLKLAAFFSSFSVIFLFCAWLYAELVLHIGKEYTMQLEPWLADVQKIKIHLVENQKSPKIVLLAGSATYFSVDSKAIENTTGIPTVNLARHAAIPFRFFVYEAERYLQKGDILVLPLEPKDFYPYTDEKLFEDLSVNFLLGHSPEYRESLFLPELFQLVFRYGTSWIDKRIKKQIVPLKYQRNEKDLLLADWRRNRTFPSRIGYFYKYMTPRGDCPVTAELMDHDWPDARPYFPNRIAPDFIKNFSRLQKTAERKGFKIILTLPNNFCYCREADSFNKLRGMLKNHEVSLRGRAEAFSFPSFLYYDSSFHMSTAGIPFNTHELIKIILHEIDPEKQKVFASVPWQHVVFAEDPVRYFPGIKTAEIYETGVRIGQKQFQLFLDLPDHLRGKDLDMNLIVKLDSPSALFSEIRSKNVSCAFHEVRHRDRAEVSIQIPSCCTAEKQITLSCVLNAESIGMERLFMCENRYSDGNERSSFHIEKDARFFRIKGGFASPEAWGCWTDGECAQFDLYLPHRFRKKDLKLTFDVLAFASLKHKCHVQLSVGGKNVQKWELSEFSGNKLEMSIPADLITQAWIPLMIRIINPRSPKELGLSEDTRKLGIGIKTVTFSVAGE